MGTEGFERPAALRFQPRIAATVALIRTCLRGLPLGDKSKHIAMTLIEVPVHRGSPRLSSLLVVDSDELERRLN